LLLKRGLNLGASVFRYMVDNKTKAPGVVIKQIRECILDGLYKPGDRLSEAELAAKFNVSRSPVREALQALESEGTLLVAPYTPTMVKPLSPQEILDMTEIRFALIALAVPPPYPYLAPAVFDRAYDLARRITHTVAPPRPLSVTVTFGTSSLKRL